MIPNPKYLSFYYQTLNEFPDLIIDPAKTALLIMDMQKNFILRDFGNALTFQKTGEWERWMPFYDRLDTIVVPNNVRLLDYFRRKEMLVTFGRIACLRPDGEDRASVQKSDGWNNILLYVHSLEAEMIGELSPLPEEIVVNKTTESLISGTNYAKLIQNIGIDTVVVTGIMTDQCVAGTVRGLADEGFRVICVEDACAGPDITLHDTELKIMNQIYCHVLSTDQTIDLLEGNIK